MCAIMSAVNGIVLRTLPIWVLNGSPDGAIGEESLGLQVGGAGEVGGASGEGEGATRVST